VTHGDGVGGAERSGRLDDFDPGVLEDEVLVNVVEPGYFLIFVVVLIYVR
jgi:hypothetical protein